MKKQLKVTGIAAAVLAAAAAAAAAVSVDLTFRIAAARTLPKRIREKQHRAERQDPMDLQRTRAQQRLEQMPGEILSITSRDGLHLAGHWFSAENAERTVVLAHGWRSTWSRDFGAQAEFLLKNHCNLLLMEQRSHGASDGEYIGFGILERYDCRQWIDVACQKAGTALPVYLFGISMGASTVLMTTGFEDLPACVRGVIADCGFTSPAAICEEVLRKNSKINPKPLSKLAERLTVRRAGYALGAYSTLDAMAVNTRPVLFIHGGADDFVPLRMSVENYEACRAPKSILVVDGAPHAKSCLVAPAVYEQTVLDFFRRCEQQKENP